MKVITSKTAGRLSGKTVDTVEIVELEGGDDTLHLVSQIWFTDGTSVDFRSRRTTDSSPVIEMLFSTAESTLCSCMICPACEFESYGCTREPAESGMCGKCSATRVEPQGKAR